MLAWYDRAKRDLPWRVRTGNSEEDFYRVWVSEIMLQQTRAAAVIPFYERFLERFPQVEALAGAPEADVLHAWSGLGYYSRARNLQRAAHQIVRDGVPATYDQPAAYQAIRALPGIGPYTAAAVGSIALGLPYAAVDGNVIRVISRLANDASDSTSAAARAAFTVTAQQLLDPHRPGDFNQAMMELGATVCVPRRPDCRACPVQAFCAAYAAGTQHQLPIRRPKPAATRIELHLMLVKKRGRVYLVQRAADESRLAGFWELPALAKRPVGKVEPLGKFRHRIVNDLFAVTLWKAESATKGGRWFASAELARIPLTTMTKKALRLGI